MKESIVPPRLRAGDRVRLVSPASTPTREGVARCKKVFEGWGLQIEIGEHVFDEYGYLAGTDAERLADINDAIRDEGVRAIIATRGGKGAYRLADAMDFAALSDNPKPFVGFSDNTSLHLAIYKHCRIVGLHGPMASWNADIVGPASVETLRRALMTTDPIELTAMSSSSTAKLTTNGTARGVLVGGNQDMVATTAGWALPDLHGAILLLEAIGMRLGHIDRQLTMLQHAGHLDGIVGVALGQYTDCEPDATTQGNWTAIDVLRDRLSRLHVPILGGLALGHCSHPMTVPIGTMATLNTQDGTLTVEAGVC